MHIHLIRNLTADGQQSMLRFADCMAAGLAAANIPVTVHAPKLRWGKLTGPYRYNGLPKWLGYLDKFVVFPRQLRRALQTAGTDAVVHILDHGNAMLVPRNRPEPWLVTCCDLFAIQAAQGRQNATAVSWFGRQFQREIAAGIGRADRVACISAATRRDLLAIRPDLSARSGVVHMGLNFDYGQRPTDAMRTVRAALVESGRLSPMVHADPASWRDRFVLHVGSSHPRKNRPTLARALAVAVAAGWSGDLVLAGDAPEPALREAAHELGVADRVWQVTDAESPELEALYHGATALVFPSLAEGFGWPVIEAQSCGCPVISSITTSLPEAAGPHGARFFDPLDHEGMGRSILDLALPSERETQVQAGLANAAHFSRAHMIRAYSDLYQNLLTERSRFTDTATRPASGS